MLKPVQNFKLQQSENLNNSTASASVRPFIQLMVIGSMNSQIFCVWQRRKHQVCTFADVS